MSMFKISSDVENESLSEIFDISAVPMETPQMPSVIYGYNDNLNVYRDYIDNIDADDWKKVRWYINKYDFVVRDPIINRAFYKYWEIINEFDIFDSYQDKNLILHCAEAPGGFIQGTNIFLQIDRINTVEKVEKKHIIDDDGFITRVKPVRRPKHDYRIYSISLNKDLPQYKMYNLPSYNRNIINKHVCITYGKDETGDINNWENIRYIRTVSKENFYLITADGGFDEGTDFNNKEQLHYSLILSEIYACIYLQNYNGHFILKVFDIFTETSIHLLYLLSICYQNVYVYKPKTSRPTNSEKYIVCKNLRIDENQRSVVLNALENLRLITKRIGNSKYIAFKIFKEIPDSFIKNIHIMNDDLIKKQCCFLEQAVNLCKNRQFITDYDVNLADSVENRKAVFHAWEETYNLGSYV